MLNIRSIRMLASIAVAALLASAEVGAHAAEVSYKYATVDNIKIFYREAGDPGKPMILLLHGFPSSSHQLGKQINRFFAPALGQQQTAEVRVRGQIESLDGSVILVLTREAQHLQLALDHATRYSAVKPVDANVIKPGTYIGAAGTPTADGVKALEVMVFREERRGTGEGHHDWDLVPGSSMTNATVSAVIPVENGHDLRRAKN